MPVAETSARPVCAPAGVSTRQPSPVWRRPQHRHTRLDHQPEVTRIGVQILDHLLARRVARKAARHRVARQTRERADGMQMQTIIEPTPGSGRRVTRLEDADGNLALFQAGGGRQSGWPRANDEHGFGCSDARAPIVSFSHIMRRKRLGTTNT